MHACWALNPYSNLGMKVDTASLTFYPTLTFMYYLLSQQPPKIQTHKDMVYSKGMQQILVPGNGVLLWQIPTNAEAALELSSGERLAEFEGHDTNCQDCNLGSRLNRLWVEIWILNSPWWGLRRKWGTWYRKHEFPQRIPESLWTDGLEN